MSESDAIHTDIPLWVGDWYVDPPSGRITRQGAEAKLEPKVMELLVFLAQHPGEVLSRESLEEAVWPDVVVSYDSLSGTVIKLRKALGDDSRNPTYLETISKKGYRLLATVTTECPMSANATAQSEQAIAQPADQRSPHRLFAALAISVVLGIVLYLYIGQGQKPAQPTDRPSIVVLPFINLTQDPAQEYFSDGITDDLINDLSGYTNLHVIARRSAYIYKRRHTDIQTIANELGVKYVLDGSIRRSEQKIRLNVQLIDAASGTNIWAQRFDQETKDIFAVQDHIRKNIVNKLSVTLTSEEQQRTQRQYTNSFEAYDLFLQGQAKIVTRASASDSQEAQRLMERAIALDPNFSRAHAALALIQADAFRFDWTDKPKQTCQQALKTGQRAIELDNRSPQAHWIMGYIYLFCFEQHDKAITMGEIATKLAPNDNDGYNVLGVTYAFGDEPAKGQIILEELMKRNPRFSALVPSALGLACFRQEKYNEALAAYNVSLQINPSRVQGNVYKALTLYRMGNTDDAEFQIDQLYLLHPNFDVKIWAARQPIADKTYVEGMVQDLIKIGVKAN